MKLTRALIALGLLAGLLAPATGSAHPAGPMVCTGVAPAESSCTTGNDHFINVNEVSTVVFVYPEFGNFRGRIRGVLTGIGNNANVRLRCDYVGDAVTDFVEDNIGGACTTEASVWPDPGDRFSYTCTATAYNSNSGNASGRFFCGVNHT